MLQRVHENVNQPLVQHGDHENPLQRRVDRGLCRDGMAFLHLSLLGEQAFDLLQECSKPNPLGQVQVLSMGRCT